MESIFQEVLDDPNIRISEKTTASDVPGWDSLSTINLVFALEREFKIRFALGEIQELGNVGEMEALIHKKQARA